MIKKILGWMIIISISVGFVGLAVVDVMNTCQCDLVIAAEAVIFSLLALLGVVFLLALALYWIFG